MKIKVLNLENKEVGSQDLSEDIFGQEFRSDILYRVVHWQLAKRRAGTHSTLTPSEVSRTTKKLYRQKGTGGARHGARKAHIFVGGGIVFGPRPRDYGYSLPKKLRALGLKIALSHKAKEGKLIVIDSFEGASAKTKELSQKISSLVQGSALFIDGEQVADQFKLGAANIKNVDVLPAQGANVYDILNHDVLVLSKEAIDALEGRLS